MRPRSSVLDHFSSALITLAPAWLSITVGFGALFWAQMPVNGFLWALACLAAGSLIGIVFGVPRAASRPEQSGIGEPLQGTHANTNMEQISDWLTKILVGAGLVELKELPHNLDLAAHYVAPSLTSGSLPMPPSTVSIAAAIIIFFSIEGFLAGYLIARVLFTLTFGESGRE